MSIIGKMREERKLVAIIVIGLLIVFMIPSVFPLSTFYPTAYEGAKATFYGVTYNGKLYTSTNRYDASSARFDTTLLFDPDNAEYDMCNLVGELTSIQIPLDENKWVPPDWVPSEWWRSTLNWENPSRVFEWEVEKSDGTISFYRMEEWTTVWFVSISAEWDSHFLGKPAESANQRYKNTDIWFEIDLNPIWYFNRTEQVYFAIAKIELSHIIIEGHDTGKISILPESPGSILPIYLSPEGEEAPDESDFTEFYYKGVALNPQYFRDKVYTRISLLDFGTQQWISWLTLKAQGDVVTFGFTVKQFVVGEWKVKDRGEIPDDYGRRSKIEIAGVTFDFSSIAEWFNKILSNPWAWLGLGGFSFLVIVAIVVIVMFWVFGPPRLRRCDEG
jgi:hypothetical protein